MHNTGNYLLKEKSSIEDKRAERPRVRGLNATVNLAANASTQISEKIELAEFQDAAAAIVLG
jgi:hypothetical protein